MDLMTIVVKVGSVVEVDVTTPYPIKSINVQENNNIPSDFIKLTVVSTLWFNLDHLIRPSANHGDWMEQCSWTTFLEDLVR